MSEFTYAKTFRDLTVYEKTRQVSRDIFQLTKTFPRDESFSLTDQLRRSSRSMGANIAEAWAKRRYEKHFLSKLTDADGEQQETQHWTGTALDCGYVTPMVAKELEERCAQIGRMLCSMMQKSDLFCGEPQRTTREAPNEYFTDSDPAFDSDS